MEDKKQANTDASLDEQYGLRPLTRGEIKALRKDGFIIAKMDKLDPTTAEDLVDRIIEMVTSGRAVEIDDQPNQVAINVFMRIVALTYGNDTSEKNLSAPGAGSKKGKAQT